MVIMVHAMQHTGVLCGRGSNVKVAMWCLDITVGLLHYACSILHDGHCVAQSMHMDHAGMLLVVHDAG
jgi:hypothetical protein